jgi:hypothetical protein
MVKVFEIGLSAIRKTSCMCNNTSLCHHPPRSLSHYWSLFPGRTHKIVFPSIVTSTTPKWALPASAPSRTLRVTRFDYLALATPRYLLGCWNEPHGLFVCCWRDISQGTTSLVYEAPERTAHRSYNRHATIEGSRIVLSLALVFHSATVARGVLRWYHHRSPPLSPAASPSDFPHTAAFLCPTFDRACPRATENRRG